MIPGQRTVGTRQEVNLFSRYKLENYEINEILPCGAFFTKLYIVGMMFKS